MQGRSYRAAWWCAVLLCLALGACGDDRSAATTRAADAGPVAQSLALEVSAVDTRFETRDHFIASVEMQLSGEPFAQAMGRDVTGFSRDYTCKAHDCSPDGYVDPTAKNPDGGMPQPRIDLAGFSTAIESYEYSKQPMNNIAFESGAGTSLLFGPVLNPDGRTGQAALKLAQDWMTHMASRSNATLRVVVGDSAATALGWPGLWPTLQPFSSWDPKIAPTRDVHTCSLSSDDNTSKLAALRSDDYECDYNSLHLQERAAQVSMTIGPGASGWTGWKEALWTLNYLQVMHDTHEGPIDSVAETVLENVGVPGNSLGTGIDRGTYLGSSDIEGFQAGNFIQILDNQAAQWLLALNTSDGKTLSGFASIGDALAYDESSPLRWFPASIAVTESADASSFPRPSKYAIADAESSLLDLAGLLGAYASVYALTDQGNAAVGGSQAARVYFDGDPFPVQNQKPSGRATLHDRALAMLRVLVVDIDRMHADRAHAAFADSATVRAGSPARGDTLSSDVAAYALLALRTARRALGSELTLYSNTTPDTAGIPCPLDAFPLAHKAVFSARLDQLIDTLAGVFYDKLTTEDGRAFSAWDFAHSKASDDGESLDAHSAAIKGLLLAYLATGATQYRERAERVWQRLDATFYDPSARVYRSIAGDRSSKIRFTPRRFGLLQGALRDTYELIAVLPGNAAMRALLEARVGRLNKLVLNGWDDRNEDQVVQWPDECAHLGTGPDHEPLGLGGLQMAERTLSGETGSFPDPNPDGSVAVASDREHDCVPAISAVGLPAALANSITFSVKPLPARSNPDAGLRAP
jgi:hypothetical protein